MSKPVGTAQSHSVIQALANNVDWSVLDGNLLQKEIIKNQKEAGRHFTVFLKNGGKFFDWIVIDRSKVFDPAIFTGTGYSIKEQDNKSVVLTEIDLSSVVLESALKKGENKLIKHEDKLNRLKKKNCILLDAGIFKTLWENQHRIPENWKWENKGQTTYIFFDGTIIQDPIGTLYVLYLYWSYRKWNRGNYIISPAKSFTINTPSAILRQC